MPVFPRPILAASLCLGESKVRYDGQAIRDSFFAAIAPHVELRTVCPEMEIGLGVPRAPIERVGNRLLQPSTGRDLTADMRHVAEAWLNGLGPVDGFLLKSRSPSCGVRDVNGSGRPGFFAEAILARYPHAAVEEENRLRQPKLRERFLTRLFLSAGLRTLGKF